MKRILSLLTLIAVICCSVTFGAYADDTDGGFDTGVLDFNDAADINSALAQLNGTGYMSGAEVQNANSAGRGTVSVADVGGEFGKSIDITNGGDGYATLRIMGAPTIKGNVAVGFSIKKGGTGETFGCAMKIGTDSYPLIFEADGYVYLCNNKMVKYEPDTWYDAELAFSPINAKKAYMRFSVKKHGDSKQNTYDTFFINGFWSAVPGNMTAGVVNIDFVYLGKNEETTYIDNVRCYTKGAEKITQTMNSMNDDFSEMPSFSHEDNNLTDYAKQWRTYNLLKNDCILDCKEVDGRQVLSIGAGGRTANYVTIGKLIRDLPEDTTSVIKFGLGMSNTSASAGLVTNDGDASIFNFASALSGSGGTWGGFEAGKIYDFQYVYNKKLGVSRILLSADGNIYEADTGTELGRSIDFQFNIPIGSEVYLSDFRYDIAGDGCAVTNQYIKSGFETANLDDTIVFEYDRTISDKSAVVCEIREKGETEYRSCAAEIKLDKIEIKPEIMKTDTEYEVRVSGAESIFGTPAAEASYSFKTADFDVKAEAPTMDGGKISAFICSAYSNAKPVSVIALTADGSGNLLESENFTVEANAREGKEYILTPSFDKQYSTLKLFIWDDILNATAYSPSAEYGGTAVQPSGEDGSEPISEVLLDKNAGKLYISGYNNSDKYNTAVIEILNDGVDWSGGEKSLADYDAAKDNILDYLYYFTQIDNLGKNKPYSVSVNYSGDKVPKIMVRFGRESAVYFDSEIIDSVNGAKTGAELKEILMNNDYVKKSIGDLYEKRIDESTENMFWDNFLERKNKAYGTDGQFTTMYRIVTALEDNIYLTLVRSADTPEKMSEAVLTLKQDNKLVGRNSFDLYFGEGVFSEKSYLSDSCKRLISEKAVSKRNSYENTKEFAENFAVNTLLYSLCGNSSKYNVYDIITNSDLITKEDISGFTALKKVNQIEVCDKINSTSAPYESISALESAIRSFAAEYSGGSGSGSGGKGSGGSSGGGSGGSSGGFQTSVKSNDGTKTDIYSDLDSVPWAKAAIEALSGKNIVSGTGEGRFSPSETVKREEFVKMLMGVIKVNDVKMAVEFADADKSAWYWEYVRKAAANGIVLGISDTEFGIGSEITREQMAAMVYRAVKASGLNIPQGEAAAFADSDTISDYAREACEFMAKSGIMNGKTGGVFEPNATATRAEAAKVIYELLLRTEGSR